MQYETKDSGERVQFESGFQRDVQTGKARYDLVPHEMFTRLAELYARGAEKYNDNNWRKAETQEEFDRFKASAFRHFMQWFRGDEDEDHASAVVFNIFCYEWLTKYKAKPVSELPSVAFNAEDHTPCCQNGVRKGGIVATEFLPPQRIVTSIPLAKDGDYVYSHIDHYNPIGVCISDADQDGYVKVEMFDGYGDYKGGLTVSRYWKALEDAPVVEVGAPLKDYQGEVIGNVISSEVKDDNLVCNIDISPEQFKEIVDKKLEECMSKLSQLIKIELDPF